MAIKVFDKYPLLSVWQRMLRRFCGGQDFFAVVYISEDRTVMTRWFTGVDMKNPIALMEAPEHKERH